MNKYMNNCTILLKSERAGGVEGHWRTARFQVPQQCRQCGHCLSHAPDDYNDKQSAPGGQLNKNALEGETPELAIHANIQRGSSFDFGIEGRVIPALQANSLRALPLVGMLAQGRTGHVFLISAYTLKCFFPHGSRRSKLVMRQAAGYNPLLGSYLLFPGNAVPRCPNVY